LESHHALFVSLSISSLAPLRSTHLLCLQIRFPRLACPTLAFRDGLWRRTQVPLRPAGLRSSSLHSRRPPDVDPSSTVAPEEFAAALRVSVQAFHAMALAHKNFLATTTEERLNKHGTPKTFALNDRVKIYVPPTHAQILRTGRKSNRITSSPGAARAPSHASCPQHPTK
jgi:hypothetical protein